ncbi:MAG: hypothetical protein AABX54_03560, partial [Nanoarchaeota archaeon]
YELIKVLPEKGAANRGIFKIENNYIKNIEETFNIEKSNLSATNTKPDDLCSMNIFALHPRTLMLLDKVLKQFKEQHKDDRKKECLLPTELSNLIKEKKIKMKVYQTNDKWFGITNPGDEEVIREQLRELNERDNHS